MNNLQPWQQRAMEEALGHSFDEPETASEILARYISSHLDAKSTERDGVMPTTSVRLDGDDPAHAAAFFEVIVGRQRLRVLVEPA